LLPGAYDVSIDGPMLLYFPFRRENVTVEAGQSIQIDAKLEDLGLGTLGESGSSLLSIVNPAAPLSGPTPRVSGGKPDLSGIWLPALPIPSAPPELLDWAQKLQAERVQKFASDYPEAQCLPNGITLMGAFHPVKFVQNPGLLIMINEGDLTRQIF